MTGCTWGDEAILRESAIPIKYGLPGEDRIGIQVIRGIADDIRSQALPIAGVGEGKRAANGEVFGGLVRESDAGAEVVEVGLPEVALTGAYIAVAGESIRSTSRRVGDRRVPTRLAVP